MSVLCTAHFNLLIRIAKAQPTGSFILNIYFPLVFTLMAVFLLYIGLKVITSKRPLLLPSKVFFVFMVIAVTPQLIMSVEAYFSTGAFSLLSLMSPLMYVVLLAFVWVQMKGYMAIGISDDSFRSALHYALNQNHIQFEEQVSIIKLTDSSADLLVSVQSWVGTGQLKLKQSKDNYLLSTLVSSINQYFQSNAVKSNYTVPVFYILFGLILLVLSAFFYSF